MVDGIGIFIGIVIGTSKIFLGGSGELVGLASQN